MPTGLIATIFEYLDDLAWFNLIWGDDWGWRRIFTIIVLAAILGSLSFYFLGGEV